VFTPAYGSVTNVRINSTMTTPQVLKLLLNKFKIENSAEEFALYVVHTSGGKSEKHSVLENVYFTQNGKCKNKTSASFACCLAFGNFQTLFASEAGGVTG